MAFFTNVVTNALIRAFEVVVVALRAIRKLKVQIGVTLPCHHLIFKLHHSGLYKAEHRPEVYPIPSLKNHKFINHNDFAKSFFYFLKNYTHATRQRSLPAYIMALYMR